MEDLKVPLDSVAAVRTEFEPVDEFKKFIQADGGLVDSAAEVIQELEQVD